MNIKKIEIDNFYSIKHIEIDFTQYSGLTLIEGHNFDNGDSNGSGKSAIIEAIVWGLFGKTIRKSNEAALLNHSNPKKLKVRLEVDDCVIERSKKPTYLHFYIKGEDVTQKNMLSTQKHVEEYLSTNYKIFLASTVYGQENTINFVGSSPEDKRIIIKNFLEQGKLFEYRETVKYLKSNYNQEIKAKEAVIQEYNSSIEEIDKKLDKLDVLKREVVSAYDSKVLELSLDEIVEQERKNYRLQDEKERLEYKIRSLTKKHTALSNEISNPRKDCSECGKPLDNVNLHVDKLKKKQLDIIEQKDVLKKDINLLEKAITPIEITSHDYKKILHYHNLSKEEETLLSIKKQQIEKIDEAYNKQKEATKKYDIMRFWEKAFSESGLVRFLIRNILKYFNDRTNFYLSHLSRGKLTIKFDEELNEVISNYGREVSYVSMSGGEKKKVSLAVTLGLQALLTLTSKTQNNLIFFDEVGEFLDQDGLYGLYILLQELKKDKVLFVITHNNYLKSLLDNCKVITVQKKEGVTTLKD